MKENRTARNNKSPRPRQESPPTVCRGVRKRCGTIKESARRFLATICRRVDITALDSKVALQMHLMQQTDDALFLIEAESGRILQGNEAASAGLGYSAEELLQLKAMDIVIAISDAAAWKELVDDLRKRGQTFRSGRHRRKDGSTFPVEVTLRLIERGGKGFVVTCARDVSGRREEASSLRRLVHSSAERLKELSCIYSLTKLVHKGGTPADAAFGLARLIPQGWQYPKFTRARVRLDGDTYESESFTGTPWRLERNLTVDGKRRGTIEIFSTKKFPNEHIGPFLKEEKALVEALARSFEGFIERHESEEERRSGAQRLRACIDAHPDAISIMDEDGRYLEILSEQSKVLPESAELLPGKNIYDVLPGDAADAVLAAIKETVSTGEQKVLHYTLDGPSGLRYAEVRTVPLPGEPNGKDRVLLLTREITDRREAEQTRDLLTAVVKQAAESIVITDAEARIVYVNPAFERITGFTADEVLRKNPGFLKSGKHQRVFYEAMWKTLLAGEVWHGVLINKKKDGTLYHEDTTIAPIRNGSTLHYVTIKRDVTEEMLRRNRMAHVEKLASLGMIASGVAHEINNPLSTILGIAQVLEDGDLKKDAREDIATIIKHARRAGRITKGLLEFSRNKKSLKSNVDLREVVEQTLLLLKHDLLKAKVRLEVKLPPEPVPVLADADQLQQMLVNLLINAKHALEKSRKKELLLTIGENDGRILLKVRDSGCGIAPEIAGKIFDPFFTTKPVGQGTGLGLAICYGIAVDHGGTITAASKPGKGSTFTLELPVQHAPAVES